MADEFSRYEVLDRLHLIVGLVDDWFHDHEALEGQEEVRAAIDALGDAAVRAYQVAGEAFLDD